MKKAFLTTLYSFIAAILITRSDLVASVIAFLMTGTVPGTSLNIPFWAMMAIYCLCITVILTVYIEDIFAIVKSQRALAAKKRYLPSRRYGNIQRIKNTPSGV